MEVLLTGPTCCVRADSCLDSYKYQCVGESLLCFYMNRRKAPVPTLSIKPYFYKSMLYNIMPQLQSINYFDQPLHLH